MPTKTVLKPVKTKQSGRFQITFPKDARIKRRINNLNIKYDGLNLTEITKLALIKLDDETPFINNERMPTEEELKAIREYLANPELLSAEESDSFIESLRKKAE